VFLLSLLFPVRRTFETKKSCNELHARIDEAKTAPLKIADLKSKMTIWSRDMVADQTQEDFRFTLFQAVGNVSTMHAVRVNGLKLLNEQKDNEFFLDTYEVVLSGSFRELLKAVNWFENNDSHGRVVSLGFSLLKNNYTKNEELQAKILIRIITRDASY
jgi:hypothetical protein